MEQIILNLVPGGVSPVCYVSQYDVGRKIRLHLRNGSDPYVLSGAETINATIRKVSGEELIYDIANTSASYVDLIVNYNATDVIGESVCELIITESGIRLGSANFKMRIDPDVYSGDQKLEVVSATSENPNLSFETNVEENLLELKAGFSPVQDLHGYDSPWIDSNVVNKKPYLMRAIAGTASRIGTHEYNKIVGGTVAFNQIVKNGNFADSSNWIAVRSTLSVSNNVGTITKSDNNPYIEQKFNFVAGHKYLYNADLKANNGTVVLSAIYDNESVDRALPVSDETWTNAAFIITPATTGTSNKERYRITLRTGDTAQVKNTYLIDLTQMFGSTIADYIYSLEQATAGAGVAWFKALFPKDYYAYNAGELISVKTSAHITRGFNQWDEEWEVGGINYTTGVNQNENNSIRSKNYIPVIPGQRYYLKAPTTWSATSMRGRCYDKDKNYIQAITITTNTAFNMPDNCCFFRFSTPSGATVTTYNKDICINISDLSKNGTYEPYKEHSYPLDSNLELRGIPKLDENNNLYYDGDTYDSNGDVTRRLSSVTLDSNLSPNNLGVTVLDNYTQVSYLPYMNIGVGIHSPFLCDKHFIHTQAPSAEIKEGDIYNYGVETAPRMFLALPKTITTAAEAVAWFANNPTTVLFYIATPTTETADPFTNLQEIDPNGSEEFVDNRSVSIPVGHESYYANICPISGYSSANITRCGVNLLELIDGTYLINGVTCVVSNGKITANGTATQSGGRLIALSRIFTLPAGTYFINSFNIDVVLIPYLNNADTNTAINSGDNRNFTLLNDTRVFFGMNVVSGQTYNNAEITPMINIGKTASPYTPYNGQTYAIAFGQTVFGGVLDVTRGKLTVTHAKSTIIGENITEVSGYNNVHFFAYKIPDNGLSSLTKTGRFSVFPDAQYCYPFDSADNIDKVANNAQNNRFWFGFSTDTTLAQAQSVLNGTDMLYELATPFDIDLTPVQISALIGENNVLSDANGGTEVKFFRMISAS